MLASTFGAYCTQNDALKQSGQCLAVQGAIANSTIGNLGRRAAGLCLALQLCDSKYGPSCSMQVTLATGLVNVSAATLDTCTGQ